MKNRSDLKHASTERAEAEDKEKKARKDLKVVDCSWLERSCRLSRATCALKWRRWIWSTGRLRRLEALRSA